jgi:hypothetical protein
MVAALSHDPDTAEWVREKERASGGRELRRIWEKAATGKSVPELSDEDLALDFAQRQADELRYVAAWGKWLVWAEGIWRPEARSIPPWASRPEECVAKLSILGSSSSQQSRRSLAPPFRVKMARVSRPRERECKGKDNRLSVGPYKPLSRRKKWLSHSRRNGFLIVRAGRGAENIDAAQAGLMASCEHSRSVNAAITSTMVTNLRGQDRGACVRL